MRGEPLKGSVSYDQRTTTLKGVEKVNDMIDGGQGAISFKTSPSAIGQKFFDSQVEKCEMLKSNDKNRFILIKEIVEKNEIVDISKILLKG